MPTSRRTCCWRRSGPLSSSSSSTATTPRKSPDFLKLNPERQDSGLVDGDLVLYETAAICLHLADRIPMRISRRRLRRRARAFLQVADLEHNTLQAMLMHFFYGDRLVDDGNASGAAR